MTRTVVVTGGCGFWGRHLRARLRERPSTRVLSWDLVAPTDDEGDALDLAVPADVEAAMARHRPDAIVHLAGSFAATRLDEAIHANLLPLVAVLAAARRDCPDALIISAGSAAEYGPTPPGTDLVSEDQPSRPATPYGLAKHLATETALYHHRTHGTTITVLRPFQLIGPGLSPRLAPAAFAERLAAVRHRGGDLTVGRLDSVRDFLDVRDACDAVLALLDSPAPGRVFNLCSGNAVTMEQLLKTMMTVADLSPRVVVDPALSGERVDVSRMVGDPSQLRAHCGWHAHRTLSDAVRYLMT